TFQFLGQFFGIGRAEENWASAAENFAVVNGEFSRTWNGLIPALLPTDIVQVANSLDVVNDSEIQLLAERIATTQGVGDTLLAACASGPTMRPGAVNIGTFTERLLGTKSGNIRALLGALERIPASS